MLERERNALKQAKDEISYLAYHDPLTELPNRRFLNRYLTRLLHAALPNQRPFALLSIDLDGFKKINDTMGHPVGDEVLAIIARRLVQAARATDFAVRRTDAPAEVAEHTIGRVGGDEFTVVLPAIRQPDDAATVARRIIEQCSQPLSVRGKTVYLGASVGIAIFPNDGQDVVSLVKNADTALYDSKCRGKGNHQFYSARMNEQTAERLWLETALRAAHENGETRPLLPAADRYRESTRRRRRSADAMEASGARSDRSRQVHPARRGVRLHHGHRTSDAARGLPPGKRLARGRPR